MPLKRLNATTCLFAILPRGAAKACEPHAVGADGTLPQRRDLDPLHVQ